MALLEQWRSIAYDESVGKDKLQRLWASYFQEEKEIYAQLLKNPEEVVTGTVKELADKYQVSLMTMTGFLDGINDTIMMVYNLEEWKAIFDEETRKALYKEQKASTTIVKEAKVYPNDPCPCGSGKKYKKCCGRVSKDASK